MEQTSAVLPLNRRDVVSVLLGLILVGCVTDSAAQPMFSASGSTRDGTAFRVTLHDDKCALDAIKNLPKRATWDWKGQVVEGCWGMKTDEQIVMAYFADRTMEVFPLWAFERVTGV